MQTPVNVTTTKVIDLPMTSLDCMAQEAEVTIRAWIGYSIFSCPLFISCVDSLLYGLKQYS